MLDERKWILWGSRLVGFAPRPWFGNSLGKYEVAIVPYDYITYIVLPHPVPASVGVLNMSTRKLVG